MFRRVLLAALILGTMSFSGVSSCGEWGNLGPFEPVDCYRAGHTCSRSDQCCLDMRCNADGKCDSRPP